MKILDEKDRALIAALKTNGRASMVSLARTIGLSRSATHDRLMRLEGSGTISGYTVLVDDPDMFAVKAVFMLKFLAGLDNRLLAKQISKIAGVVGTYCVSGDIDMIVHAECSDTHMLTNLRDEIVRITGVDTIRTYSVLSVNGR